MAKRNNFFSERPHPRRSTQSRIQGVDQFWSSVTLIAVADLEKWHGFYNQSSCGKDALRKKALWSRVRNQVGQAGNFYKETNTKEGEKEQQVVECSAELQSQEGKCYTKAKHKERLTSKTQRHTKEKKESKRS